MARYPTPEEAERNFISGTEASRDKWALRSRSGATRFRVWYTGFARAVYPVVARLPEKTGDLEKDVVARVVPVIRAIKALSTTYKEQQIEERLKALPPITVPATV